MEQIEAHKVKVGMHVMMDGLPCRVRENKVSTPGKHGAAKCRLLGTCVLTGKKREVILPGTKAVPVAHIHLSRMTLTDMDRASNTAQLLDEKAEQVVLDIVPQYKVCGLTIPEPTSDRARALLKQYETHGVQAGPVEVTVLTVSVMEGNDEDNVHMHMRQLIVDWCQVKDEHEDND